MRVTLQYFDGCPNWEQAESSLAALRAEGFDLTVERQAVTTPEAAARMGFRGSPTILIDGEDPFADPDAPIGLACRVYPTDMGLAGSPSIDQLRSAIERAR